MSPGPVTDAAISTGMESSRPAVVVAGTGVPRFAASTVYATLAHALDADVVALDGLGLAHTMHSVNAVTEMVARIVENDGVPVALVGHSQGGLVAAIVASEHPGQHGAQVEGEWLIVPHDSGLLPGARHYVMDGVTHTGLIHDRETVELVSEIAKLSWASSTQPHRIMETWETCQISEGATRVPGTPLAARVPQSSKSVPVRAARTLEHLPKS